MLKVGRQCKLAPKSDYCSKHKKYAPDSESSEVNTITTTADQSIESSTITDTIMCQYQDSTPMKESVVTPTAIESTHSNDLHDKVADYCSTHSIQVTRRMQTTEKEYCVRMAYMIIRICVNDVHLFLWPNSEQKTTNLVQYINSIGLEAHEIILIDHCRMFMDIDIVLTSKQYRTLLSKFESEDHFTGAIIDAYEQACNLSIHALGHTKELDYVRATRVRPIDSERTKIGIHIVANAWMPISYAKYIATDMRKQMHVINTDLPEKMLIDGIDTAPYRMRGSLSLPGGIKNGVRLEGDGSDLKYFYISRNDESTPVLDKLDIKITEYQPQDINNEFIKEALQHVESIPDWSDAFDLDASTLKGPNMIVRRVKPSNCSVCGRRHDADSTLRLNFNSNSSTAFWKCSKAPEGTKAKVWYKSKDAKKPASNRDGKPIDVLRAELLEICRDRFRREEGTGAIYEHKYDYYYTYKYDNPAPFLTHIFHDNELYSSSGSSVHKELIYFIKHIVHPDFKFMSHDYDYIGFTNGVYDLSTATFVPTDQIDKIIQVRKMINQDYKITPTPLLDSYFRYQFHEDDIEFIYFMLGRMLTRVDDHFDFMLFLYGVAGSGKSLLMKLILYTFSSEQIGILSSSFQGTFGLCEFANRQIVSCDDMPSNLAKTLDRGDFLKMGTRGSVSCPVKNAPSIEVHDWNIPTMINSNVLPNYKDHSGEIVRRVMVLNFENVIPEDERNTSLESDIIKTEISSFIHKCRSTYLSYKIKYRGKGVETFCPQVFLENRKLLRLSVNNTSAFINERFEYSEDDKDIMKLPDMNKMFKAWMKDRYNLQKSSSENINAQSIGSLDSRITYRKVKLCKHCKSEHTKNCCSKYSRTDRTSQERVYNIKFKSYTDDPGESSVFC